MKTCEYDECGKKFKPSKFGASKYCSGICRQRAHTKRNGRAKDIKCRMCGEMFSRGSANNIKCERCRERKIEIPQTSRERELEMQKEWIKKNKVTIVDIHTKQKG